MFMMKTSDPGALEKAADILLHNGVAIIPTDTVYGLAAHPAFPGAVARLQTLKARENPKPVAMLIDSPETLPRFVKDLPDCAARLAKRYWPGPLTLVLDTPDGTEGFRVPNHDFCRALLARCGGALRVTSANLTGQLPATSAAAALEALGLTAELLLDDGDSPGGVASTVIKVAGASCSQESANTTMGAGCSRYICLREGAIPFAECLESQ